MKKLFTEMEVFSKNVFHFKVSHSYLKKVLKLNTNFKLFERKYYKQAESLIY